MTDMSVLPIEGGMGSAGAAGVGGAIGGLIGSWFGNGWGGGARGGAGALDISNGVALGANVAATALISDLATLQDSVTSNGFAAAAGIANVNQNVSNSMFGLSSSLTQQNTTGLLTSVQGFSGLNTQIQNGTNQVVNAINTSDVNALTRSFQAQLEQQKCCCETNANISREAEATRALIRDQFATSQAVLICDLKSQLASSRFETSQAVQTGVLTAQNVHLAQLINFKIPTPPTPPTV